MNLAIIYYLWDKCKTIRSQYKKIIQFHLLFKMLLKSNKEDLSKILIIYFKKVFADMDSKCIFAHAMTETKVTKLYKGD
ncbi:hypothetical protein FBFR_12965 [Flavobacterium fryxellicola]|uniref:Uncharacterized protein n=1 Tax=Flavobacterium fryxellicola TaxID=249352 RepID=A0A167VHQ3_9FLAO|nr:hypothetical protein FBFR_12965 [Flavobacterium fryxellicola]